MKKKIQPKQTKKPSQYPTQVFTYFIPAPPPRKTGYREKQFDQVINSILEKGFAIESIKTQSLNTDQSAGLWIVVQLRPLTNEAKRTDLNQMIEQFEGGENLTVSSEFYTIAP